MIFVTVGTNEAPFDRLLQAVGRLPRGEELVVQHGSSSLRPFATTLVEFLPFEHLVEHVRRARVVVTHAGVGSVVVALTHGKQPIVMPRLNRYGEAVDDHQHAFAERFERAGLVALAHDSDQLRDKVAAAQEDLVAGIREGGPLADDIRRYLVSSVGHRR